MGSEGSGGGGGGIREGGGFILEALFIHAVYETRFWGSFETELEQWDLQCTPGLRGFGLGGLGHP